MNRFLIVIVLVAVCVAGLFGLGLYEKWISFSSSGSDGKGNITLTVDKDKMQADEKKALDEIKGVGQQVKDKVSGTSEQNKD
jgi:hypothetical protein